MRAVAVKAKAFNPGLALALLAVGTVAFAMVVVTFGMDNVIAGAHDTFHDFRHTLGMGCH